MSHERSSSSCVLIGSESLLIQCGEILLEKGHTVAAVVSKESQILEWAESKGLTCLAPGKTLADRLGPIEHDYLFSITNLSMIPEAVLALPGKAAINFHDGPLPRYAGMYTPAWAILNGETEYGVSFHEMTVGADEGDLYVQRFFEIGPDETSLTLNTRCYEAAIDAFSELVDGLRDGTATKRPQNLDDRSYFGRLERPAAAAVVDFRRSAAELSRQVRALNFGHYENAFAAARVLHGGRLHLVRAAVQEDGDFAGASPGEVLAVDETGILVACGDGHALRLDDWTCPKGLARAATEVSADLSLGVGSRFDLHDGSIVSRLEALGERATRSEAFWVRRLGRLESAEIPYRNTEVAADATARRESIEIPRPSDFTGDIEHWIAGFAGYVARLSGLSRFDLGYADDRLRSDVSGLEEVFSSRVPLRVELEMEEGAGHAVDATRKALEQVRDRSTFFADVSARYPHLASNPDLLAGRLGSLAVEVVDSPDDAVLAPGVDCALVVHSDGTSARLLYETSVLSQESARQMVDQLGVFLAGFAEGTEPIGRLPLLSDAARARILESWNETACDYPSDRCIHELFDVQAAERPGDPALVFEDEQLSYAELAERANRLAHHLVQLGAGPDQLVGIYLDRSVDMVVAVLAVLKAGGAYVPLDPTYPEDRIAYMIEDSKAAIVLTSEDLTARVPRGAARIVAVDGEARAIAAHPNDPPAISVAPENLSYVIYTSGSTGKPKGVMVEHRNVVNFFAGMDERIPHDPPGVWLAVTSLSFDISVLELLWTLTRGFKLVVHADRQRNVEAATGAPGRFRPIEFGLALWGSDAGPGPRKYELMIEAAKYGDTHGFGSVMTPERHFGAFGGPFPNPAVTSAAIAAVTERIQIRAGSCVLPLHHPIRVAEEWAVVDNLSGGRVGISFASGWQPNDFVIRPEGFADAKTGLLEHAQIVKRLWQGEAVPFENPNGELVPTATLPRPVQEELPSWLTTAGNVETFRAAGAAGMNVLTHLLGQSLEELTEKIKVYRRARADAGLDPKAGIVTCMLHTFVGEDLDQVRETVRLPMKDYLSSAMNLVIGFAWSFPAFQRPGGADSKPEEVDLSTLTEEETDAILEFAFERYFETSGLFGTPEVCGAMVDRVKAADIDDIACLIDFGLPTDVALSGLDLLDQVRREANAAPAELATGAAAEQADYGLAAQIAAHGVTHMQCTPSHASMLLADPDTRGAVSRIEHWMIGGEAFPVALAAELHAAGCGNVTNMYGPTETTIWSSTEPISGRPDTISIGRPIANTQLYILDDRLEPLPVGVPGELLIGGDGVVRGYLDRPELTSERFVPDPFRDAPGARLYRTGDLAAWNEDGSIEFLGRLDHQVKIRGYRIELGEIEARLAGMASIREAVVIAREDTPGDVRLVAYLIAEAEPTAEATLSAGLSENLPDFMVPSAYVYLDRYPQTPNGKIDRKALPAPDKAVTRSQVEFKPPGNELEETIAKVWKDVLFMEEVGIDDNFFDLGGHSLLVVQAHRKLREEYPRPLSLTDLYRFPTVRGLAGYLGSDEAGGEQVEKSAARGAKRREALGRRRKRGGRG